MEGRLEPAPREALGGSAGRDGWRGGRDGEINLSGATSGLWPELRGWKKDEGVESCLGGDTQSQRINWL